MKYLFLIFISTLYISSCYQYPDAPPSFEEKLQDVWVITSLISNNKELIDTYYVKKMIFRDYDGTKGTYIYNNGGREIYKVFSIREDNSGIILYADEELYKIGQGDDLDAEFKDGDNTLVLSRKTFQPDSQKWFDEIYTLKRE
jgi:hypothetical protein